MEDSLLDIKSFIDSVSGFKAYREDTSVIISFNYNLDIFNKFTESYKEHIYYVLSQTISNRLSNEFFDELLYKYRYEPIDDSTISMIEDVVNHYDYDNVYKGRLLSIKEELYHRFGLIHTYNKDLYLLK